MSSTKKNIIFAVLVLALAGGLFLWQRSRAESGVSALLEYGDSGRTMSISLKKNARYDVDTGVYTVHLEVADGAIRFVESPCPDHVCEGFGWLRQEGDWAACLPAKAMLTVGGKTQ